MFQLPIIVSQRHGQFKLVSVGDHRKPLLQNALKDLEIDLSEAYQQKTVNE